jgi:hypothetical protein
VSLTLGQKQELFSTLVPKLIAKAHDLGYPVRLRTLWREPEQCTFNATHCGTCRRDQDHHDSPTHKFHPIGTANSLHADGLALDLVLMANGAPLTLTESYRVLGQYWEAQHALCRWGGSFGDGGHFSITHGGRR